MLSFWGCDFLFCLYLFIVIFVLLSVILCLVGFQERRFVITAAVAGFLLIVNLSSSDPFFHSGWLAQTRNHLYLQHGRLSRQHLHKFVLQVEKSCACAAQMHLLRCPLQPNSLSASLGGVGCDTVYIRRGGGRISTVFLFTGSIYRISVHPYQIWRDTFTAPIQLAVQFTTTEYI